MDGNNGNNGNTKDVTYGIYLCYCELELIFAMPDYVGAVLNSLNDIQVDY